MEKILMELKKQKQLLANFMQNYADKTNDNIAYQNLGKDNEIGRWRNTIPANSTQTIIDINKPIIFNYIYIRTTNIGVDERFIFKAYKKDGSTQILEATGAKNNPPLENLIDAGFADIINEDEGTYHIQVNDTHKKYPFGMVLEIENATDTESVLIEVAHYANVFK